MKAKLALAALMIGGLVALSAARLLGDDPPAAGINSLGLKSQLEKGLRARRPVEFTYIADVVKLVDDGKLPRTLVDSAFVYARLKPSKQIQHFQFSLRARAQKLGIVTPTLDNQAVYLR